MARIVYVNGTFCDEADATVSIFDRGYLFGDGVYEVVPVINRTMVDVAPFYERLDRSLGEIDLAWPCGRDEFHDMLTTLIERNNLDEGIIYMQVTRGVAERDFAYPKDTPTSLIAFTQVKKLLDNPAAENGVKVVSVEDIRWKRRDIKSIALLGQCVAKQKAAQQGAFEGWMVEDGHVTEGTSSSAYIVKDGTVITRPLSNSILPGIRRRLLMELTEKHNIKVEERLFTIDEAYQADEAFLSSASTFVMPITQIDDVAIGGGKPGPVSQKLRTIYLDMIKAEASESQAAQ